MDASSGLTIGRLLQEARLHSGLTQRELARQAALSLGAVRDLEQGRSSRPRPQSVDALADALGLGRHDRAQLRKLSALRPVVAAPTGALRIRLLGPLTMFAGNTPVPVGAGRHRIVLARLALTPERTVSRDELIGLLWPVVPPASAPNVVQTHVSRLRRLLDSGEMVEHTAGGYRLHADDHQLDLLAFRAARAEARLAEHDAQREYALLSEALELWHGHLPAEDVTELAGDPLVTALADEMVDATVRLARLAETLQRLPDVLPRLRRLAVHHPWNESLHARLIVALAASGQQAAALDTFDEVRRRLADELGVDPGAELDAARQAVLDRSWTGPRQAAPQSDGVPIPWQAPAPPADFTGRVAHLARLETALRSAARSADGERLAVCVVSGMAGVGKTALALRVAQRLRPHFPDGQLYADLRGSDDEPVGVIEALARLLWSLGVPGAQIPADAAGASALLRSALAGRRLLIILDNARNAAQIRPLLPGTGGNAVLVTSRNQCAELEGAILHDLPVLDRDEALEMLVRRIDPARVSAASETAVQLVEACGRLPVAVRIVAARLAADPGSTLAELRDRLADSGHRLDQFSVGDVAVTATFDLSYRELTADAAATFRAAALVPGGSFTAETLTAMLAAGAERTQAALDRLVADNLVQAGRGRRFRQHDLLRLYGRRRAGAVTGETRREAVLRRLFEYYLTRTAAAVRLVFAEAVRLPVDVDTDAPGIRFDSPDAARAWLDEELGCLLEAIREAAAGSTPRYAWLLADQLRGYFALRRDAVPWLASGQIGLAAAVAARDALGQAAMHQTIGQAQWAVGRHHEALQSNEQGIEAARRCGWRAGEANLLENSAIANAELGRVEQAISLYRQVLVIADDPEFDHIRAFALNDLGALCVDLGRLTEAERYFSAALEINGTEARLPSGMKNRFNLAIVQRQLGDPAQLDEAQENLETVRAYFQQSGSLHAQLAAEEELSALWRERGNWRTAVEHAERAAAMAERLGDRRCEASVLTTLGSALLGSGAAAKAREMFARALRLARAGGFQYVEAQAGIGDAEALLVIDEPAKARAAAAAALAVARGRFRILEGDASVLMARAAAALT